LNERVAEKRTDVEEGVKQQQKRGLEKGSVDCRLV
jgi:hypothetical protein